jgi:broad specificity phosphatase PhoE
MSLSDSGPTGDELTVVHLLRHGEVHNPRGVLYGRLPEYHLSDLGREMAERVAKHLADADITQLVSSPLERAQETAAPAAKLLGLPVTLDERLIEAGNIFEGKTFGVGDGALYKPSVWLHLRNPFRPSWGEPYKEIAARMLAAIASALGRAVSWARSSGEDTTWVTSVPRIRSAMRTAISLPRSERWKSGSRP